jgi:hypothetical protein
MSIMALQAISRRAAAKAAFSMFSEYVALRRGSHDGEVAAACYDRKGRVRTGERLIGTKGNACRQQSCRAGLRAPKHCGRQRSGARRHAKAGSKSSDASSTVAREREARERYQEGISSDYLTLELPLESAIKNSLLVVVD